MRCFRKPVELQAIQFDGTNALDYKDIPHIQEITYVYLVQKWKLRLLIFGELYVLDNTDFLMIEQSIYEDESPYIFICPRETFDKEYHI